MKYEAIIFIDNPKYPLATITFSEHKEYPIYLNFQREKEPIGYARLKKNNDFITASMEVKVGDWLKAGKTPNEVDNLYPALGIAMNGIPDSNREEPQSKFWWVTDVGLTSNPNWDERIHKLSDSCPKDTKSGQSGK